MELRTTPYLRSLSWPHFLVWVLYKYTLRWPYRNLVLNNPITKHLDFDYFFSGRADATVKQVVDGSRRTARYRVYFAHFDPEDTVQPYVFRYLDELLAYGGEIVFSTTSGMFPSPVLEQLKQRCCKIVFRKNSGLDFGSWGAAVSVDEDISGWAKGVLFANDSVLGPAPSLAEIFAEVDRCPVNTVLGLTDCYLHFHHLQSYFLFMPIGIYRHPEIKGFWKNIRCMRGKPGLIQRYEVGFSRLVVKSGFSIRALYSFDRLLSVSYSQISEIDMAHRWKYNPSIHCWHQLFYVLKFPFVKKEIVTKQRCRAVTLARLEKYLSEMKCDWVSSYISEKAIPGKTDMEIIFREEN